jgi:hypothetical protein
MSRSDSSPINGAKSQGPVTSEGKARSAQNSLRHGLTSKALIIPGESREEYNALFAAHVERFQPADPVELPLVEAMADARWRLRRMANIESALLTNQMAYSMAAEDGAYRLLQDDDQRLAYVFDECHRSLSLLNRYESSLNRSFDRALKQLQALQKSRPTPPPTNLRNEPNSNPIDSTNLRNEPNLEPNQPPDPRPTAPSAIVNSGTDGSPSPSRSFEGAISVRGANPIPASAT